MKRAARMTLIVATCAACGSGAQTGTARAYIPPGTSLRVASDSLAHAGLIRSPRIFRLYAKLKHGDKAIRSGTYELKRGLGYGDILDALTGGKGLVRSVTIPEGFSVPQVVKAVATKLQVPPETVDAAVRDTALLHRLDVPAATLDGYLFPDTYTVPEGTGAREVIAMMTRRFEQVWIPGWTARLDT